MFFTELNISSIDNNLPNTTQLEVVKNVKKGIGIM